MVQKCPADMIAQEIENLFGATVAKHYDVFLQSSTNPRNSNEGILHNVIEHCEEGDRCF